MITTFFIFLVIIYLEKTNLMNKNYLSLLVIMGILITGTIPNQQLAFADSDELEVEIEIENGLSKIKVEFDDDEYEFQLATSDIDEILKVTSLRTGISIDLLEEVMEIEVKDEHDERHDDDEHEDDRDEDHDEREEHDSDDFETETFERKLRASTLGDSSEVKIELEFVTETIDSELLIDEILANFVVTQEEAENALKIQPEDDDELEEKFKAEIETEDGVSEVEVELRFVLDSTNRDDIISSIIEQSQLDRDLLRDVIEIDDESDDSFDGLTDDSDSFSDDRDSDDLIDDSENKELREENKELREENQLLRDEINDLREQLANLNTVLMEQIRVIMDTISSLKS